MVAAAGCAAPHAGVAPWDVPDDANPNSGAPIGAPPLGDPPGLIRADGTQAHLPDGTTVELVSVGRRQDDPAAEKPLDARPIWTPSGAPLYGGRSYGWNNVMRPASALEGKGARYLEFRIAAPPNLARAEETTVTGYVPDYARQNTPHPELHGWDVEDRFWIPRDMPGAYRTCVAVDDRSAQHYRFALARGEWTVARSVAIRADDMTDAVLAQGAWGVLRRVAPPKEARSGVYLRRVMSQPTFVVDPPAEPPAFAYQIRLLDAEGKPNAALGIWTMRTRQAPPGFRLPQPAVRVEVSTRPYTWIEFSGVHYDPDPAKWAKGYWGDEGERAISRAGSTSLQALIRPVPNSFSGWDPGEVYAPDGRLWRNHPDRAANTPLFSGNIDYSNRFVAAFELDPTRVDPERPARIEAFAADGTTPGKGLGESLARSAWSTRPADQMMFPRPKTPYVQFAVRYASDRWTKAGEIRVPNIVFPLVKPEDRAGYDNGSATFTMFSVILRSTGVASLYWHTRSANIDAPGYGSREALVTWPRDEEARVVARLKSGRRIPLSPNSFGTSGDGTSSRDVDFNQASDSDPVYDTTRLNPQGVRLKLSEIDAFEVETRGYSAPVYVVAKLPPSPNSAYAAGAADAKLSTTAK